MASNFRDPTQQAPQQARQLPQGFTDPSEQAVPTIQQGEPRGLLTRVYDFVTGNTPQEFPEAPEISALTFKEGTGRLLGIFATSVKEKDQVVGVKNRFPGTQERRDSFGNLMVQIPRKFLSLPENEPSPWVYINKPGLSTQDSFQAATQAAAFVPGAALAARAPSVATRALAAAPLAGVTSVGQDLTATALGTEQGVDPERAAVSAAFGAGAELAAPTLGRVLDVFRRRPNLLVNGQVTDQGRVIVRQELQRSGVSAEEIAQLSDDALNQIARNFDDLQAGSGNTASELVRQSEGQSLPVPVPQTRGQLSQNPRIQMAEDLAEKGTFGDVPRALVSQTRSRADNALQENTRALQTRIGGRETPRQRGQGPAEVSRALSNRQQAAESGLNQAFTDARNRGASAGIPVEQVRNLSFSARQRVMGDHSLAGMPNVEDILSQLDELGAVTQQGGSAVLVNELFRIRRLATSARGGGGEQAVAARKIVGEVDEFLEESLKQSLISGDDSAVSAWQNAIRQTREMKQVFNAGDLIEDLTEQVFRGEGRVLKVDPGDAANYVLGRSAMDFVGRRNLYRDMGRLRTVLGGPDAPEWNALREEVFLRVANRASKGLAVGENRVFNGTAFMDDWMRLRREDPRLTNLLFTESEQNLITQFGRVAQRVTSPVRGGANFSNTTPALARLFNNLLDATFLGPKGQALLSRIPGLSTVIEFSIQAPRAAANVRGGLTPRRAPGVSGALTAGGEAAANER